MNKIKPISFTRLRNESMVGFLTDMANTVQNISVKDVKDQLDKFRKNVRNFSDYTTNAQGTTAKKEYSLQGANRIVAFRNFKNIVKALRTSSDTLTASLSNDIWAQIKKPYDFASMDQKRLTGVIENAIETVRETVSREQYATSYEGSELQKAFDALCSTEAEYANALQNRVSTRKSREEMNNKKLRDACIDHFNRLVTVIQNSAIVNNDATCIEAIDKINILIVESASLYKFQAAHRKKKKEEEKAKNAEAKNAEAANTEVKATEVKENNANATDSMATEASSDVSMAS